MPTSPSALAEQGGSMPLEIVRNDIAKMKVDAIVTSANHRPVIDGGVDGDIHKAAGPLLLDARRRIGRIAVGEAVITPAYDLDARFVIHTAGPFWNGGGNNEERRLRTCYERALEIAVRHGCATVAFPLISSGLYGFPKNIALNIAVRAIGTFLLENDFEGELGYDSETGQPRDLTVYLVVFDPSSYALSKKLMGDIANHLDESYVTSAEDEANAWSAKAGAAEGAWRTEGAEGASFDECALACHEGPTGASPSRLSGVSGFFAKDARVSRDGGAQARITGDEAPRAGSGFSLMAATKAASSAPLREVPSLTACAPKGESAAGQAEAKMRDASFEQQAEISQRRIPARRLEDVVRRVDETFAHALLRLIDERGLTDPAVYKRANIDRKLFSKIRTNPFYQPSKATALALAVALKLNLDETRDFIARAGYALTHSSKADLIVEYFILHGNYNIFEINEALLAFDQPLIGR